MTEATRWQSCSLCLRKGDEPLVSPWCQSCAERVAQLLLQRPQALIPVWSALVVDEEEASEPEPRVHLSDGRTVELREHTEAMKKDLAPSQRLALAQMLGDLGLHREQLLECAVVLSKEPATQLTPYAVGMLTAKMEDGGFATLRGILFPS